MFGYLSDSAAASSQKYNIYQASPRLRRRQAQD